MKHNHTAHHSIEYEQHFQFISQVFLPKIDNKVCFYPEDLRMNIGTEVYRLLKGYCVHIDTCKATV